jgi:hypothetical protein
MPYSTKGKMQSILDNLNFFDNDVILVDSNTGVDTNTGKDHWSNALATLDAAIAKCAADNADKILIAPGHAEEFTTAANHVTYDIDGITIIGIGVGDNIPTFTFSTDTGATMLLSGNSIKIENIKFKCNIDSLTTYLTVSGDDNIVKVKVEDQNDIEVVDDIKVTGDRNTIEVEKLGDIGGNANQRVISMNGCTDGWIKVTGITAVQTGIVNFVTVLSTNIEIELDALVYGITDSSKMVVDTIGSSVYRLKRSWDRGREAYISGGSVGGIGADDVDAQSTEIQSYTKVEADAVMSYVKVENEVGESYTKVEADASMSYTKVYGDRIESYTKVEADASMSYTKVEADTSMSYTKVYGDRIESYTKVEADAGMSYSKVYGDLILSYIEVIDGQVS